MPKTLLFLLLSLVLWGGCKPVSEQEHQVSDGTPHSEVPSEHGFDELSSDYYDAQSRVIWQKPDLVLNLLGDLRGKTVADIGAGTGFFSFRIANQGVKVIAVDVDPRAIAWIEGEKTRYPTEIQSLIETRLANEDDPNLKPGEVDIALMVNTYIYIQNRVNYFRDLAKSLKHNGELVIIDFKKEDTPLGPEIEDRLTLEQVRSELVASGYEILLTDDKSLEYQYIIKARSL